MVPPSQLIQALISLHQSLHTGLLTFNILIPNLRLVFVYHNVEVNLNYYHEEQYGKLYENLILPCFLGVSVSVLYRVMDSY